MISLVITLEVKPEQLPCFIEAIQHEAVAVRANEPGCLRFEISQSLENPCVFTLAELYEDEAALAAHRETPHFKAFQVKAAELDFVVSKTRVLGRVLS